MTYKKYNTWNTLRTVMLGSYFYPEYFSKIHNSQVREPLMRMAEEINEDLDKFQQVLENFGAMVIRAPRPTGYFDQTNPYKPPLQIRNTHAVVGDCMYQLNPDWHDAIDPVLRNYCPDVINLEKDNTNFYLTSMEIAKKNYNPKKNIWYSRDKYNEVSGSDWPTYDNFINNIESPLSKIREEILEFKSALEYETKELAPLQGPNVINTDDFICVDANEYCNYENWLKDYIKDSRPIRQFTSKAGHVDGCFAVLGNKTILGIDPLIDYANFFPGYSIVKVPSESYQHQLTEFKLMKEKVNGSWWLAGEEHNDVFINYVETNLKSWVGHVAESVFDVNVLALDAHTICVSNITPEIEKQLQIKGIECILVPWRHRFFVDGGLHCITLDLYRD
jgi:N-dimethylarginine dimethylaminohydrolase